MTSTVKTKILIISDTHCAQLVETDERPDPVAPFKKPLPEADLLIHCGDLTYTGQLEEYHQTLDMLKAIDAPVKLVIAGNHDLSLDRDFVFSHRKGDGLRSQPRLTEQQVDLHVTRARNLWTSPDGRAKSEGISYLDEGVHEIDLPNGARVNVYASPYTPEFLDWGFPYERDEDRFNPPAHSLSDAKHIATQPIPSFSEKPIDIVVTHGPPWKRLDQTTKKDRAGCPHLLRALMRARPLITCFGHIHEGYGAEIVRWAADADEVTQTRTDIDSWKSTGWQRGITSVQKVDVDLDEAKQNHAASVDVAGTALTRGEETLMLNAAIMNIRYQPHNAPWLVEVDLPKAD